MTTVHHSNRRRWVRGLLAIVTVCGVALAGWALVVEPSRLVVRRHRLALPGWPPAVAPLSVALVSDLHVGAPFVDAQAIAHLRATVDALRPDVVLLAGDVVVGHEPFATELSPAEAAATLAGWTAPLGVYAVLGNHDWWTDGEATTRALADAGVRVLENEAVRLERASGAVYVVGLADAWTRTPDAARALAGVPDGAPVIAFTQNPDVFPELPARFSVVLAGHTHGGQVALPLVGRPVVPSKYRQRYAAGHVVEDDRHLFVTTGVGTSVLPVRLGVPPEVVLLTLTSQADTTPP
ncbi:MAG: metallophosphoesterase [Myxococcaceae bacterium]|nr:metallophosphoesterase [Myxococcaceae bacterium]